MSGKGRTIIRQFLTRRDKLCFTQCALTLIQKKEVFVEKNIPAEQKEKKDFAWIS